VFGSPAFAAQELLVNSLCPANLQSATLAACDAICFWQQWVGSDQYLHRTLLRTLAAQHADQFALAADQLPSQPGALRRLVWRRWPEQGSPECRLCSMRMAALLHGRASLTREPALTR